MWYRLLILSIFSPVFSNNEVRMSHTHAPAVDALILQLKLESWDPEEIPCMEKTVELLENVKNFTMWATWVWNANMLPVGNLYGSLTHLGNFDQCMNPPWLETHHQFKTQFCVAELVLSDTIKTKVATLDAYSSTEEYLKNAQTKSGITGNQFRWGVCMPASCHPHSVAKIIRILYLRTNYVINGPNVTVTFCQVAGVKQQYAIGFYIFFVLLTVLFLTAAVSTYNRRHVYDDEQPNSLETIISTSFCMRKNHQDLMKSNKEEIPVMNGMRFITAVVIILGHVAFFTVLSGISNTLAFEKEMDGVVGMFVRFDIVVDTFFAMSGLLHIKGLLSHVDRQKNLFAVLWKRYIRLIGPFAVTIFYIICVSPYTGSGPIWPKYVELEPEVCTKTWPLSLLMLNSNIKHICHVITWSISCDYQLAILGTVLFYFYQKDRRLGMAAFGTAAVFSLIIPGVLTYWHQLPAIHFLDLSKILVINPRDYWEINYTYLASYSRAGAYLVGIAMAYLMTVYRPIDHRNTISKTWSIIGTGTSLTAMMCMLGLGQFYLGREYYPLEVAFTAATNRTVWALAVCCIIGLCEYGTVPLVSNFLGLSIFAPLSRLSYGIYLIHSLIIERNKFSLRNPWKYDLFYLMTEAIATLVMSIVLSYVMWLLVEAPMINICNYLLFPKSKSSEGSKVSEKKGILDQRGHIKTKAL